MNTKFEFLKGNLQAPIDSLECKVHYFTHPNCEDCKYELGCKEFLQRVLKFTAMVLIERKEMTVEQAEALEEVP